MKRRIAVLGAGPAGLCAAWKLLQQDLDVDVIEKKDRVGGLSASISWNNYTLDYGPHDFHLQKGQPQPLVRTIYDYELEIIERKTKMLLEDKTYTYPFKIFELLGGLNPKISLNILLSYIVTMLRNNILPQTSDSFEAWGVNQFGRVLYDICFGNYTTKVWGVSPAQLSPSLGKQKILNKLSLVNFIKTMLGINKNFEQYTHYHEFVYPLRGSGHFFNEIARNIKKLGGNICLNATVNKVVLRDNLVQSVCWERGGVKYERQYSGVISTMPLSVLINSVNPVPLSNIIKSVDKLRYRALILIYLLINKEFALEAQMVYLLDKRFKCNRITEQKQYSRITIPDNKTVLTFERCCNNGDELWSMKDEELYKMVLEEAEYLNEYFTPDQIDDYLVVRLEDAYPVFSLNYEDCLSNILQYISRIKNMATTGRNGLFLNNDMHECMTLGIKAAQNLIKVMEDNLWHS